MNVHVENIASVKAFREIAVSAQKHGGRHDLLSVAYTSEWTQRARPATALFCGHPQKDPTGAVNFVNQLFIEVAGPASGIKALTEKVYTHPDRIRREPYFDEKRAEAVGRNGLRLGVSIAMDDRGELIRTYYVRGPGFGQRIMQNLLSRFGRTKKLRPPDGEY